jgi:hypothetical protein
MTLIATKFTPEVMLSAPRRSAAVPNSSGTLALYTVQAPSLCAVAVLIAKSLTSFEGDNVFLREPQKDVSDPSLRY